MAHLEYFMKNFCFPFVFLSVKYWGFNLLTFLLTFKKIILKSSDKQKTPLLSSSIYTNNAEHLFYVLNILLRLESGSVHPRLHVHTFTDEPNRIQQCFTANAHHKYHK